jgi:signal transduction histidine kinase
VTRERGLEEEVRQAQKMEAVGRLAGGIAHDFNNLLTAIVGYVELIEDALAPNSAVADDVAEIRRAANRASDLTRQLLAFSRRQVLKPRVLDLNESLAAMQNMLRRLIPESIAVETKLGSALGRIKADPGQLEQVVLNLALNARDAIDGAGAIELSTAETLLLHPTRLGDDTLGAGRYVRLAVKDAA